MFCEMCLSGDLDRLCKLGMFFYLDSVTFKSSVQTPINQMKPLLAVEQPRPSFNIATVAKT